ncbi:IS1 family transposase [Citrobacter amalonaticus]|uniref:transposase n=1 Tax=Citrobacter amalonaticus TaxID=35703 RepID=UPI001A232057|nr:hypothetical protein [Citrobacter amalonaticus]HAT3923817.1 hypothetical protein [Citrobacter amalonaticus]
MKSQNKIHLNVCKSWSCPNLGVAEAADYIYPVYRLGYAALECQKCGGLPPLFNEREFNHWFALLMKNKPDTTGAECPHCSASDVIRYGRTQAGHGRFQCRLCRTVFTPQQTKARFERTVEPFLLRLQRGDYAAETTQYRLLAKAVDWCEQQLHHATIDVKRVATKVLVLPFQGKAAKQQLYAVISADACSGRILQVTTNYSDEAVGDALLYKSSASPASQMAQECTEEYLRWQEIQFMQRSQFDEIHYGSAQLKRNDRGCILRPVIAIHGHFQRLKRRFPAITDHYLAHECVLRGAAITAWSAEVQRGTTNLWFVLEDANPPFGTEAEYRLTGNWNIGWWNNVWQRWSCGGADKIVCSLTGQKQAGNIAPVSLRASDAFVRWLHVHPWSSGQSGLGAKVLSRHVVCLAYLYNHYR